MVPISRPANGRVDPGRALTHMKTRILAVDPDTPDVTLLAEAARILRGGGLVAFATETVYGLGADATNSEAVARIFAAKGRPSYNPLIVHASDLEMARGCVVDFPAEAERLADRFWPGPLTLVLARAAIFPDAVTAGRETVGIRIPAPAVARHLIALTGRPIAAPSANRSNAVSPTLAEHVREDLDGRIDLILDSGPTAVGIESTVLDCTRFPPRVLRPGPIGAAEISKAMGATPVLTGDDPELTSNLVRTSPGQLSVHYAPTTPAWRVDTVSDLERVAWPGRGVLLVVGEHVVPSILADIERVELPDSKSATRDLYRVLHESDRREVQQIVVVMPPDQAEWQAVIDRLKRATRPVLG